jgi:hypothetical protein
MRETHTKHSPSRTYYNTHEGSFNLIKEEIYESMAVIFACVFSLILCKWCLIAIAILMLFIGAIFAIAALCGK